MTDLTKAKEEFWLTQAQYDARKDAGTLVIGAIYHITDVEYVSSLSDLGITATATELNYSDGVTSNIQTQLDTKVSDLSGLGVTATAAELNTLDGITATTAELNYTDGVTSNIQTQLDTKINTSDVITATTLDIDSTPTASSSNLITSGGVYTALANKVVNDGTLTIQKNGTTVETFTANSSTDKIANIVVPGVIDNVTSTSTTDSLSANMGKELQTQISNLQGIGRFLAIWDASTGTPTSEPTTSPYTYKVGDYFRVGTAGTKNPATNLTYIVGGTNWVEGSSLSVGDVVYCSTITSSASTWVVQQSSGGGTVQDVQINGTSILSSGIANIPISSQSALGTVKVSTSASGGIMNNGGLLSISKASDAALVAKTNLYAPVVPNNLDVAIREGLGNNSLTWTDAYKASARTTIGAQAALPSVTNDRYLHTNASTGALEWVETKGVFIATYGTTTYADVLAAYNAGKMLFAKYADAADEYCQCTYSFDDDGDVMFGFYAVLGNSLQILTLNSTDGWDADTLDLTDAATFATHTTNTNLHVTAEKQNTWNAKVDDVQVNGSSVVSEGVASVTVPTVNDATLTVQKNGTAVATFSANSATNTTANITVPTAVSELTNDSGYATSSAMSTALATKVNTFTESIYVGSSGNPRPVKFCTVNYSSATSEAGIFIKISLDGTSYNFLEDAFLSVNYIGGVSVENFKYYGTSVTYDSVDRQYGDIFWVIDTDNSIVDFYVLCGQYSTVKMTPYQRLNNSSKGIITQLTSLSLYSTGDKVWGTNSTITRNTTGTGTLTVAGWSSSSQTITVTGVTASNTVIVSPAAASASAWADAQIVCTGQSEAQLTFSCGSTPTAALTVNVVILD